MSIFPQKEHYSFNSKTSNSEPLVAIKTFDMTRLLGFVKTILFCHSVVQNYSSRSMQKWMKKMLCSIFFNFSDCLQKHVLFLPEGKEKLLIGGNSILKCLAILF